MPTSEDFAKKELRVFDKKCLFRLVNSVYPYQRSFRITLFVPDEKPSSFGFSTTNALSSCQLALPFFITDFNFFWVQTSVPQTWELGFDISLKIEDKLNVYSAIDTDASWYETYKADFKLKTDRIEISIRRIRLEKKWILNIRILLKNLI